MFNKFDGLVSYWEIKNILSKHVTDEDLLHNMTNDLISNFYIYPTEEDNIIKWYHRLNLCWILPLMIVFNSVKWVFTGRTGVKPPSRMGKLITKLTGRL